MRIFTLLLLSVLVAGMTSCGSAKEKKQQAAERVNTVCPLVKKPYLSLPGVTITNIFCNPDDGSLAVNVSVKRAEGENPASVQGYASDDKSGYVRSAVLGLLEQSEQGTELLKVLADNDEGLDIRLAQGVTSISAFDIREAVKKKEEENRQ